MSFNDKVNSCLNRMHSKSGTDKGVFGELAVLAVCERMYQATGGLLYHSYSYKVDKALPGNIEYGAEGLYVENLGDMTEIDILLVTPYRIFPIEVKSYKASKIVLTDDRILGCLITNKSPIHQNEMHARHLYSGIIEAVPEGNTQYIQPICVFTDECTLSDNRSEFQRSYIHATVLSRLSSLLRMLNTPIDYRLDLEMIQRRLNAIKLKCEKEMPLRDLEV